MTVRIDIDDLGALLLYDGRLARVLAIAEGRTITLEFLEEGPCPTCGNPSRLELLEHAPLFQEHIAPVRSIG